MSDPFELSPRFCYIASVCISIEGLEKKYSHIETSCHVHLVHEEVGTELLPQQCSTAWKAGTSVTYCDESNPLSFSVADGDIAAVSDATLFLDFRAKTLLPKKALLFKCLEEQQCSTDTLFTCDAPIQEVLMTARFAKRFEYLVPGGGRLAVLVALTKPTQGHYLLAHHPAREPAIVDHNEEPRYMVEVRPARQPRRNRSQRGVRASGESAASASPDAGRDAGAASTTSGLPAYEVLVYSYHSSGAEHHQHQHGHHSAQESNHHVHFSAGSSQLDNHVPKACRIDDPETDPAAHGVSLGAKRRLSNPGHDDRAHRRTSHTSSGDGLHGSPTHSRRSSLDDGHLRAGRQLLARCRPSGGSTYDVDLAVAPRYATLNTWAQISYRMPQAVALPNGAACTDVGSFALQVSEGPHFTLQRINLGNPFEGFAVRNPVDGCEVAANGSAKHRAGASNKIHPSGDADGGKGQSAGGSAMWELRLASNSKVGLPTRVSDSDVRSHSSGNAAGRFDSRRVLAEQLVTTSGNSAPASRMHPMAVFGDSQVAVIGVARHTGRGARSSRGGVEYEPGAKPRDLLFASESSDAGDEGWCEVALEVHPRAADIAPGLLCLAHLMHALHNHQSAA